MRGEDRDARRLRAERADQRPDQAVAGEQRGARTRARHAGEQRLLERGKYADIAGRGIERADEGDDQQRPEIGGEHDGGAGRGHQQRGGQQQTAAAIAMGDHADGERHDAGAEQGGGDDEADVERAESEQLQVERQQQAHEAVAESARPACPQQDAGVGRGSGGQEKPGEGGAQHEDYVQ